MSADSAKPRYEPLVRIGTGGMATVHVARARGADGFSRLVALKRAHPHVRDDPELRASMRLEARIASRLHHPNVVGVLDVDDTSGELELVLDYVEGCTLSDLIHADVGTRGDAARAMVRIVLDVAAGLEATHRARGDDGAPLGLVHRDVSPSNVLVGIDGIARLSDFGIANALEREGDRTTSGVLKGKIGYMAPEYVEHHHADARSDQFSLAVMAWECLAQRRLFKAPTELESLKKVLRGVVPKLSEIEPSFAPLDAWMARALARRPEDRFASVAELASELEAVARDTNLVGSHGEVTALVEACVGDALRERRRLVASARRDERPGSTRTVAPPSSRDAMVTASIVLDRPSMEALTDAPPSPSPEFSPDLPAHTPSRALVAAALGGLSVLAVTALVALAGVGSRGSGAAPGTSTTEAPSPSGLTTSLEPVAAPASPLTFEEEPTSLATSSADAGKKRGGRGGAPSKTTPALVPTKAPPNPYAPKP